MNSRQIAANAMFKTAKALAPKARRFRATRINAFDEDEVVKANECLAKIDEAKRFFEEQYKDQLDKVARLDRAIAKLTADRKALEKELKGEFKAFDQQFDATGAIEDLTEMVARIQANGEGTEKFLASLDAARANLIKVKDSRNMAYKGAYETMVSMLNKTEYAKWFDLLARGAHKAIASIEVAVGMVDGETKAFAQKYLDEYRESVKEWNERNPDKPLPLQPKASVAPRVARAMRKAGFGSLLTTIWGWVKGLFTTCMDKLHNAINALFGLEKDYDKADGILAQLTKAANDAARS